jgi:clan AA aspartic protease (TIGR02281 family)
MALPLLGTLVLAGIAFSWHAAWARPAPPLVAEEMRHARSDFAAGGIRRLSANWNACVDRARDSQDANAAERCVVYGYSALLLGDADGARTPWMRHLTADIVAPGQIEMLAIMGIPEGPRQAWLDRYRRWVSEDHTQDGAETASADADGPDAGVEDAGPAEGGMPRGAAPRGGTSYGGTSYGGAANAGAPNAGAPYGAAAYGGAPRGRAASGGGPDGGAPYGRAPYGAAYGDAPDGRAASGGGPDGGAPYGRAPYGAAAYGGAPDGRAASGSGPDGGGPNAGGPNGRAPYGAPYGGAPDGRASYGGGPDGGAPYGRAPYGAVAYGGAPDGRASYGGGPGGGAPYGRGAYGGGPDGAALAGGRGTREGQTGLAQTADGKYPRQALREPGIADAVRELVGASVFSRLKQYSFGSPMEFTGRYTVGIACEPRACGVSEARFVFSPEDVWVGIVRGGRLRLYGDPPRPVRALLLRDRNQTVWRGAIEDMTGAVQPQVVQASVESSAGGPPPRLTIAPHPFPAVAAEPVPAVQPDGGATEVRLRNHDGTFEVPVTINGAMTLPFAIDSGASDVSVSADVMEKLIQAGTVSRGDFLGKQVYHLADGSAVSSETFRIHVLKVGDREVRDVMGSITNDADSLLLGQSFLNRFRSWSIDNQRQVLLLK